MSFAPPMIEIERFSTFAELCRVFANMRRLIAPFRKKDNLQSPITSLELSDAEHSLISLEQRRFFKEEINLLKNEPELSKWSSLRNLYPCYDTDYNALGVGGRCGNSKYHELRKFPFLIPKNHN